MTCHLKNREKIIRDYLNGNLDEQQREAFEEHLFICDVCYREVRLQEIAAELVKTEGPELFPGQAKRALARSQKNFWSRLFIQPALAGAFVLVIVVSTLIFYGEFKKTPRSQKLPASQAITSPQTQLQAVPRARTPRPSNLAGKQAGQRTSSKTAPNFVPFPLFEEILSSQVRSLAAEIRSPRLGEVIKSQPVRFEWKGERGPFFIKILNNRGQEIFRAKTAEHQLAGPPKLPPGLYYWKLETQEELLYLGKFTIPAVPKK